MASDERVFLVGEDIGVYGGAFKVTRGFLDFFGPSRVIDAPIAEGGFTGAAAGAAHMGLRPVVEMQFMDFISAGVRRHHELHRHFPVPREWTDAARRPGAGRWRKQGRPLPLAECRDGLLHTPGLKIVYPSNAYDAKGLLKASIRDDNPVIFEEHKGLYRAPFLREVLPQEDFVVPLGKARIVREGRDVTVVTYGLMVHKSAEAAAELERDDGLSLEIVDLRTLLPLDDETIIESVKKTGRLLVVHEDTRTGGIAGEIAMRVSESASEWLDAPMLRVTAIDSPVPYSATLEDYFLPQQRTSLRRRGISRATDVKREWKLQVLFRW